MSKVKLTLDYSTITVKQYVDFITNEGNEIGQVSAIIGQSKDYVRQLSPEDIKRDILSYKPEELKKWIMRYAESVSKGNLNNMEKLRIALNVIKEEGITLLKEKLEPDFEEKAKAFINKHINIVKDAVKFYKNRPDDYEDSLIQTIYNFFEKELGEDWTTQISTPNSEDEKNYTYGWTDEKDEVFYNVLKSILK